MSVIVTAEALPKDPLAALRVLVESEVEIDRVRRAQVIAARSAGATWQEVGDALGVSRQSAWESFTADARSALAAADDGTLSEDGALDLAVAGVRAARGHVSAAIDEGGVGGIHVSD